MKQATKSLFENALNKHVRSLHKIEEGFCNDNYLVNNAYVMRIPRDNPDETTLPYKDELEIYSVTTPLKISEIVVYFDVNSGVKISKFIHKSHTYRNTPTNEEITYVAKALKKLHGAEIKTTAKYDMFGKLKSYKNALLGETNLDSKIENKIIKEVEKIFDKDPLVLCHNDLVHNNLLFLDKGVKIIDWEYAGLNNLYFDLASFISENDLSDEQAEFFLSKYFGSKLNLKKRKKVEIFYNFLDVLFYYRGLYMYKRRGDKVYENVAKHKLERLNNLK